MSLEMRFTVEDDEFSIPIRDNDIFARLAEASRSDCEIVFGVDEPEDSNFAAPHRTVMRESLLSAIDRLLAVFKTVPELTPRRFLFDYEVFPGVPIEGAESVCALGLPGKPGRYELFGGVNRCELRRIEVTPGQLPVYGEPIDVHDLRVLETESYGPIRIRATKKISAIVGDLKHLRKFLQSVSGDTVTKALI